MSNEQWAQDKIAFLHWENTLYAEEAETYSDYEGMVCGQDRMEDAPRLGRDELIARNLRAIDKLEKNLALSMM